MLLLLLLLVLLYDYTTLCHVNGGVHQRVRHVDRMRFYCDDDDDDESLLLAGRHRADDERWCRSFLFLSIEESK